MKHLISILLALILILSCAALAEGSSWTCPTCGEAALDTTFCPYCGTARPAAASGTDASCEGAGYDTPQEAATAYVEAINSGDIPAALSTFAVETFIDNVDTEAYIARYKEVSSSMFCAIPAAGSLSRGLLIEERRSEIAHEIFCGYLYYSTLNTDFAGVGQAFVYRFEDDQTPASFLTLMRENSAESCVGRIRVAGAYLTTDPSVSDYVRESYTSEKNQSYLEAFRAIYNAEQIQEVLVFLTVDNTDYVQAMQCVCYNGKWYNMTTIANISVMWGLTNQQNGLAPASAFN